MTGPSPATAVRVRVPARRLLGLPLLLSRVLAVCATAQTAPPRVHLSSAVVRDAGFSSARTVTARPLGVGRNAWVAVSVAPLWRSPGAPRVVDAPALARPARIEQWLSSMTLTQRRSLYHRSDTQALFGDRVRVVRLSPGWAKVVVPSQPSQLDPRGYPGWVPRRQLTTVTPAASARVATVVDRTTWLRPDQAGGRNLFRISFGTRLPVRTAAAGYVRVVTPTGTVRRVSASAVVVHDRDKPAIKPTRRSVVRTAKLFLGLPYLWAGLSGFGLDYSGLTWLDYRVHGIRIPRDALPQSRRGKRVSRPRPGDLIFYARGGVVHHVSMYIGNGRIIHAPGTGRRVQTAPSSTYASEKAGTRSYLP